MSSENLGTKLKKHAEEWQALQALIYKEDQKRQAFRDEALKPYQGKLHLAPEKLQKEIKDKEFVFATNYAPQSGVLAKQLQAKHEKELEEYKPVIPNYQSAQAVLKDFLEKEKEREPEKQKERNP